MASLKKCGFIALDGMYGWDAFAFAERLRGHVYGMKVNDSFDGDLSPREVVGRLKALGFKVFADTKYHDIPMTVANRVKRMAQNGADLITVHASGGREMVKAAVEAYASAGVRDMQDGGKPGMGILAVTVLTSLDDAGCWSVYRDLPDLTACRLVEVAKQPGLYGFVCSPQELKIMEVDPSDLKLVTPGLRSAGAATHDQARADTPANALGNGANYLVIGREVTQAPDPLEAIARINASMAHLP